MASIVKIIIKAFKSVTIKLFLVMLTVTAGCIEKFDYKPESGSESILVVDGGITDSPSDQYFNLSFTTIYGLTQHAPAPGANIRIYENGKIVDICEETEPGKYLIHGNKINPRPGNQYSMEIDNYHGKTYRSEPETMPYPVTPDSAYFKMARTSVANDAGIYVNKWIINIYVDTPVRTINNPAFFRWRVGEAYSFREVEDGPLFIPKTCYVPLDITYQDIQLYSGGDLTGGILKNKLIFTRYPEPNVEFIFVHYFNIYQYSITRKAYGYWSKLKSVANPTGSFIDTPPAAVIGNVYNINDKNDIVLGYFEVSSLKITRIKSVPATLLPYYVHDPCADYPSPDFCYSCLSLPNSSLVSPAYW